MISEETTASPTVETTLLILVRSVTMETTRTTTDAVLPAKKKKAGFVIQNRRTLIRESRIILNAT